MYNKFYWDIISNINGNIIKKNNRAKLKNKELYNFARLYSIQSDIEEVLILRINQQCHYKCIHCFIDDGTHNKQTYNVPYETIINKIKENSKHRIVLLTGGEPMFHPDFNKILQYCKDNNIITAIETNMPGFHNKEKVIKYANLIDILIVPYYSYNESIYEEVTQITNSYSKKQEALKNVKEYMPNTGLNFVVVLIKKILPTFYNTVKYLIENYKNTPIYIGASCLSGPSSSKDVSPSFEDIYPYLQSVLKDYGEYTATLYIPPCFMYPYLSKPHIEEIEREHGGITGLELFHDNSLEDIYFDLFSRRSKVSNCRTCNLLERCEGFLDTYHDMYNSNNEVMPILDNKFKQVGNNCKRCGSILKDSYEIITRYEMYDDNDNLIYKSKNITRELCKECYDNFNKKLDIMEIKNEQI